jgi:hypothetical protein
LQARDCLSTPQISIKTDLPVPHPIRDEPYNISFTRAEQSHSAGLLDFSCASRGDAGVQDATREARLSFIANNQAVFLAPAKLKFYRSHTT